MIAAKKTLEWREAKCQNKVPCKMVTGWWDGGPLMSETRLNITFGSWTSHFALDFLYYLIYPTVQDKNRRKEIWSSMYYSIPLLTGGSSAKYNTAVNVWV